MQYRMPSMLITLSIALAGCGQGGPRADETSREQPTVRESPGPEAAMAKAAASMRNMAGKDLGTLTLADAGGGIRLAGRLTGLPPGEHAIHLHTTGGCEAPKFESAGGHWNPMNRQHGTKNPQGPHLGDLPNFTVGPDSSATVDATTPGGSLTGKDALLDSDGAAVVVHAKADDYRSQPAGKAGDRIGCGVVGSQVR